ncbi:putative non-ribosomal peptide synthetase [Gordonia effusa NBRC 100432]|uniref:Putative non-ribosomal peptide synthetase n=1 Tax=Gordonia effusa NBRC 100432 TaxID=1077974 RepID=H0QXQ6_9ACTN|nr:non-ribosomal peptide synthetase [Gordonia effusa]GAB17607.1 putative non-ribosomal peptide synthetase [Gordonia effusa NBRC 100432]
MTASVAGRKAPEVQSPDVAPRYPLTAAQRRAWFRYLCEPGSAVHNFRAVYELAGPVDADRLRRAFDALAIRHDVLRSTFAEAADGEPSRVISGVAPRWDTVDLADLSPGAARRRAEVLLRRDAMRPFDLRIEAPLRITLIHRNGDDAIIALSAHAIAFDDESLSVVASDISALYTDHSAKLPAISPQSTPDSSASTDVTFWRRQFQPLPEPVDLSGGIRSTPSREAVRIRVDAGAEIETANQFAASGGFPLQAVLLSVYAVLIQRYTGAADFAIAVGTSTRDAGSANSIGCYANTMLLRAGVDPGESFAELVTRVDAALSDADTHRAVGIDDVVRALNPTRSRYRDGMEQVVRLGFSMVDRSGVLALDGNRASLRHAGPTLVGVPIQLSVDVGVDGAALVLDAQTGHLDDAMVEQVLRHFRRLVESASREPSCAVAELDMLGDAERANIIARSTGVQARPAAGTLVDLVSARAESDSLAIVSDVAVNECGLTYRDLDAQSNQLARNLIARGIGTEDLVGLRLSGSAEFVVAMLAVLKSGAAYLPIDPAYPEGRIEHLIADAKPRIVIDAAALADAQAQARTESVDRVTDAERVRPLMADNLAYVMYTSGSTGTPKGVPVSHAAICDHITGFGAQWDLTAAARVLQISSVSFDASMLDLFVTLNHGATLVVPDAERIRDMSYLAEVITRHRISVLHVVPSLLRALLALPESREWRDLTHVPVGGEALPGDVADRFAAVYEADLRNYYGPTEAVVSATHYSIRDIQGSQIVPIGQPNRNVTAYILDERLQLVADNVVGEIYLGGPQLARGYLSRPTMTAEHFVADPFCSGRRLYRTGDLARRSHRGDIEFVGRADQQVKIRGHRVELGEIAATLNSHPTVRDAVVVVDDDHDPLGGLTAYLTAADTEIDLAELRAYAAKTLPDYMIPGRYAVLADIPRSVAGKLDKATLPPAQRVGTRDRRRPKSRAERRIAEIFAELLGAEEVSADDSFFELGGHSLIASRLVNTLRTEFGVATAIRDLFEHPTVAGLAALVEAAPKTLPTRRAPAIRSYARTGQVPPSPAQHIASAHGGDAQVRATVTFDAEPDSALVANALSEVVARHEILGMAPIDFSVERVEADDLATVLVEDERRGFDLGSEKLWRARLFTDGTTGVFTLAMHRSITDSWSLQVIVDELAHAYGRHEDAAPRPGRAAAEFDYTDHVYWQAECVEIFAAEVDRLDAMLASIPEPTLLLSDTEIAGGQDISPDPANFEIDAGLRRRLRGLATADGASEFMFYQAMVAVALNALGAGTTIALAGSVSGRADAAMATMVGPLSGVLVLRHDLSGSPTLRMVLEQSRDAALGAYGVGDLPAEVLAAQAIAQQRSRPNVWATVEVREENWPSQVQFGPGLLGEVRTSRIGPGDGLRFEFIDAPHGGFQVRVTAGDSGYRHGELDVFARTVKRALETFADHPNHGLAELAEAARDFVDFSVEGHNDENA